MYKIILIILLFSYVIHFAYADQIFTTYRSDGNQTTFDGKWSFLQEWKRTSYNAAYGENLVIRTGHDYKNLYVLIDFVTQQQFSKYSDFGIVCIDSKDDKESIPQKDDYCFLVNLASNHPIILRGGNILGINNHFVIIGSNPSVLAVGGISDENDRYSSIPHTTYEFQIPLEIIGKSDKYGFFAGAYVAKENKFYNWPEDMKIQNIFQISSPASWGELISPDKSIPEFPWPSLLLLLTTIFITYLGKVNRSTKY